MSENPVIFISHAHDDAPIAEAITRQLNAVFMGDVKVFNTSIRGGVGIGRDWFGDIETNIDNSSAFIVLVTPKSINKHWVWFELGAFWLRRKKQNNLFLYPLSIGLDFEDIPEPLHRLQIQPLNSLDGIKIFFETLCHDLKGADLERLNGSIINSTIIEHLPKYLNLSKAEDEVIPEKYASPFEGYSDESLVEILTEFVERQRYRYGHSLPVRKIMGNFEPNLFSGFLTDFKQLDNDLRLPSGTSKKLLKSVAARQGLIPILETETNIRFEYKSELDKTIKN